MQVNLITLVVQLCKVCVSAYVYVLL